ASRGIGIEILLPERTAWNHRYLAYGSGGYAGGHFFSDPTAVAQHTFLALSGVREGYVTSDTDDGHISPDDERSALYGSWAMRPDGSLSWPLLQDWAYRALHEMAVRTKALVKAYY